MHSADRRYVITYNGEVYNFRKLRAELEHHGHRIRGTSDTEVTLAACVQWRPEAAVQRFVGMFAFALLDRQERTLRLVRDRMGQKPLYWTMAGGTLLFGFEFALADGASGISQRRRSQGSRCGRAFELHADTGTVFKNVFKLPAARSPWQRAAHRAVLEAA
jgi:asparagine synthase (glutamine-hydrolysing)